MNEGISDPAPPTAPAPAATPSLLNKKLKAWEVLVWGAVGFALVGLVIGYAAWEDKWTSELASPLRVPSELDWACYTPVTAYDLGIRGEGVAISGELVAADFEGTMPQLWIADESFGIDSDTGLPRAVRLAFPEDAEVMVDGVRVAAHPVTWGELKASWLEQEIYQLNLKHHAPKTLWIEASVRVVVEDPLVISCTAESRSIAQE